MLCELCDAPAHTYCAGLGNTVPAEDWFCKDCAEVREEHLRWQAENEDRGDQGEFEITIDVPIAEPVAAPSIPDVVVEECDPDRDGVRNGVDEQVPSIYDIVDDDFPTFAGIRRRPGRNTEDLPSQGASTSAGSQHPGLTKGRDNGLGAYHAAIRREVERARTLRNSRNLDKRIRELRENWAALRDGSVGFAPSVPNARGKGTGSVSAATEHQRCTPPATASYRNVAPATSAQQPRPSPEEPRTSVGPSNNVSHKDARDARKAWKRLEIAKTSGGRKGSSKPAPLSCSTPFSMGNRSTSYSPIEAVLGQKNSYLPNKLSQQNNTNCGQGTKMESTPPAKYKAECHSLPEHRRAWAHERTISFQNRINQESLNGKVALSIQDQHAAQSLAPSCSTGRLEKPKSGMLHPPKCSSSSGQSPVTSSGQMGPSAGAGSQSTMMVNPEEPSAVCAATTNEIGSAALNEVRKSSRADRHERKRKHNSEKCNDEGSKRSRSASKIAKSEISALAVRELKLFKIDKTHGIHSPSNSSVSQHITFPFAVTYLIS
jgi:PHD and RING finger domain-containing protein 1